MHIGKLFDIPEEKKKGPTNQRAFIIQQFCLELDKGAGLKFKDPKTQKWRTQEKVKPGTIAFRLSHLKGNQELWDFLSQCRQSKSGFAKCFYGALKVIHRSWDQKN